MALEIDIIIMFDPSHNFKKVRNSLLYQGQEVPHIDEVEGNADHQRRYSTAEKTLPLDIKVR